MKRNCLICNAAYDPQETTAFFRFKYCSEKCETQAEQELRLKASGEQIFMCIRPLEIFIVDGAANKQKEVIQEGSKWLRDDSKKQGLNAIHLVNLSGRADEKVLWLEVDEVALTKHFQKI